MTEKIQKKDFIEIEFTGTLTDGSVFDTNDKEIAKKNELDIKDPDKIICVGEGFLVKGFDEALIDKEMEKEYTIELTPKKAFGDRRRELIKTIPIAVFHKHKINPTPSMSLFLDQHMVRISAVSGGRVITDFNNPLAGKIVKYTFKIIKKITDQDTKIKSLMKLLYRQEQEFSLKDKKITINADKNLVTFIEMTKEKWKEILDLEVEVKEKKQEEKSEKKQENTKTK